MADWSECDLQDEHGSVPRTFKGTAKRKVLPFSSTAKRKILPYWSWEVSISGLCESLVFFFNPAGTSAPMIASLAASLMMLHFHSIHPNGREIKSYSLQAVL
jgi:hypothetical protein